MRIDRISQMKIKQENWDTDIYRIDEHLGSFIWLERILICEGEVFLTEDYRCVSKQEFLLIKREGRIKMQF